MPTYAIAFVKSARREFDALPTRTQEKVLEALGFLAANPFSDLLRIKKLRGAVSLYRLRVGDYRVVYEILRNRLVVLVIKIGHRSEVYRRL
ncbi:MAG: type II toxin-antitoxin system RelE/ParE family toxin [Deltaproteobacteria bacterium]|nr:type II toxin-antitoxin system RelE/ParE family toxin [Deltaproteobacteria bacterium]